MSPTPKLVTINAWSYSTLADYQKCHFLVKCRKILKLKEPDNPAYAKGNIVHELAAKYATKQKIMVASSDTNVSRVKQLQFTAGKLQEVPMVELRGCPSELERFSDEFAALRRRKNVLVEQEWAFNRRFEQCDWRDWDNAWLRIKTDLHYIDLRAHSCEVVDFKTGKEYPEDHATQRKLYALGALLLYPDVTQVRVAHWYLEQGTIGGPETWRAEQLADLQEYWLKASKALLTDTLFAPNPGPHCQWCNFSKERGGPCVF